MSLKPVKLAFLTLVASAAAASAQVAYVSDGPGNQPWFTSDFQNAMSTVFGSYQDDSFTQAGTSVFNPANKFIFIDGGGSTAGDFDNYFNTPGVVTALQNWVAGGGSVYIDGGRWPVGDGLDVLNVGFGINLVEDDNYSYASYTGTAAGPSPIFNGASGTSWSGNYFSHDVVTADGATPLIYTGDNNISLAEENYGAGHVMVGGLVAPTFQSSGGYALLDNILGYDAGLASVPDSGTTLSLLGAGIGALSLFKRIGSARRKF